MDIIVNYNGDEFKDMNVQDSNIFLKIQYNINYIHDSRLLNSKVW
jgi:hypothetical protein